MAYKPAQLPPDLRVDARVEEVMAFRRESSRTVFRKIASGAYKSYKSGDTRLILWESVLADRERCLALGPQLTRRQAGDKRQPGRPRKSPPPETKAATPAE
jgi:hypothetical protein